MDFVKQKTIPSTILTFSIFIELFFNSFVFSILMEEFYEKII